MGKHRKDGPARYRLRYGRLVLVGAAALVTMIATLGGLGIVPISPVGGLEEASAQTPPGSGTRAPAATDSTATGSAVTAPAGADPVATGSAGSRPTSLPAASGTGRRIVFAIGAQRVWLVDRSGAVQDTYPVSGSLTDNLGPGRYRVYSRSRHAYGVEDSGTMEYFVRFAHGEEAAIGFHSIPVKDGVPLQSVAQLGTPQSHGCIRQRRDKARELWNFAPLGTPVVVVA